MRHTRQTERAIDMSSVINAIKIRLNICRYRKKGIDGLLIRLINLSKDFDLRNMSSRVKPIDVFRLSQYKSLIDCAE